MPFPPKKQDQKKIQNSNEIPHTPLSQNFMAKLVHLPPYLIDTTNSSVKVTDRNPDYMPINVQESVARKVTKRASSFLLSENPNRHSFCLLR
jgi:hypothetical protein